MPADLALHDLADTIRRRVAMTPGTLTSTMDRSDHPVGLFLRALATDGVRLLDRFPSSTTPCLVDATAVPPGQHGTVGTAFGWLLRLRLATQPTLREAQAARSYLPPHAQVALWELDTWIEAGGARLNEPGDLERAAVVLSWCEQIFRAGPFAAHASPLLRTSASAGAADLLDLVPDIFVDQLDALARIADDRLIPALPAGPFDLGVPLDRNPIAADADLIAGTTLLDIKCTQGSPRAAGRTFSLTASLIRQLLGYALLADDPHTSRIDHVAVYAARYGLYWTMPITDVIELCGGRVVDLADARAAFARLWAPAA